MFFGKFTYSNFITFYPIFNSFFNIKSDVHHITFNISFAILSITGTTTLFPAHLYNLPSDMSLGSINVSGNPCRLKVSHGVNFLIPNSVFISGTLWPPVPIFAVKVGHTLLLFSRTYFLRH